MVGELTWGVVRRWGVEVGFSSVWVEDGSSVGSCRRYTVGGVVRLSDGLASRGT